MTRWGHHRPAVARGSVAARARAGERGAVLLLLAVSMATIVTCTALTVDLGRVFVLRRDLQNVADAAALDLVRLVDGRVAGEIAADPRWTATLDRSLAGNGFAVDQDGTVDVALGSYTPLTDVFTPADASEVPTAVEVVVTDRVDYHFAPGGSTASRRAVASQTASAGVQVGSFAARLDTAQSPLLNGVLGDALQVTGLGYSGLAGGRVGVAALATELDLSLGHPDELLDTELTVAELIAAQASVLQLGGDAARAAVLGQVVALLPAGLPTLTLRQLLDVRPGGTAAAAVASLDALELLTATAFVANGTNFLDVPAIGLSVPGVIDQELSVRVIEKPRWVFGPVGSQVETAQVRVEATVTVEGIQLLGLLSAGQLELTLALDAASTWASITDIVCGSPRLLAVAVETGLATVRVDVSGQLLGVALPLLPPVSFPLEAWAEVARPGGAELVEFAFPPDEVGEARSVSAPGLGLGPPDVHVVRPALLGIANGVLSSVIGPLVTQLDALLLDPLLSLLGVAAPGADVTPLGTSCSGPRLVS